MTDVPCDCEFVTVWTRPDGVSNEGHVVTCPNNPMTHPRPNLERVASECDLYGHDYQVKAEEQQDTTPRGYSWWPTEVFCTRCPRRWRVWEEL